MTQLPLINTCMYQDCTTLARNKTKPGYCRKHQMRIDRHGSPDDSVVKGIWGKAKGPYCALFIVERGSNRYWATTINRQTVCVHRLAAEIILDRKLHTNEHVHHVDGNGLNNHPNNFEVLFSHNHNYISGKWSPNKNGDPF